MWHTEALVELVRPGMTAIDVGANLGYFTLLLGDLVGPTGRVHAFEPNRSLASRLRRSVGLNGFGERTTVHEAALYDDPGEYTLIVPEHEPKNAHMVGASDRRPGLTITAERLDGTPELLTADFIKIDVEGAEERVWRGMAGLLASGRPLTIVLEYTGKRYKDPAAFVDELGRHGFALSVIDVANGIVPIDRGWLLAQDPEEDQLVVLRR